MTEGFVGSSVYELVRKQMGLATRSQTSVATVGTTKAMVLSNNPRRISVLVVNIGGYTVYLSFDSEVATDHGIALAPNGGALSYRATEDGELSGSWLWGIAPSGTTTLYIVEVIGE